MSPRALPASAAPSVRRCCRVGVRGRPASSALVVVSESRPQVTPDAVALLGQSPELCSTTSPLPTTCLVSLKHKSLFTAQNKLIIVS